ncbi:SAM-dependent methyltransferase, partial [Streptomyces sp. ActVer]|nr:SAM-dependent methyltransferase [Streptomyces sp. ActVer]
TRVAEQALNPLIGKSFVAHATKPHLPVDAAAVAPSDAATVKPSDAATVDPS